jgi:hypothetical protein
MRLLQRLGWACGLFGVIVLIGQLESNQGLFGFNVSIPHSTGLHFVLSVFIQFLWLAFLTGAVAMAMDKYWGRWLIALSSLIILAELLDNEVFPAIAHGGKEALSILLFTWPGVSMGRGPISLLILAALAYTVIAKGLARRPSNVRRGSDGEHLRTRETD